MILYVNGDSHTAAAEAINNHAFAEDDPRYPHLGRLPHPDNLTASWGRRLAEVLKMSFKCDAESAASNARIMRTTREWIQNTRYPREQIVAIIQWSTWEREEWLIDGVWYQINASGADHVPTSHQQRYKEFVAAVDWKACTTRAHAEIWSLHQWLEQQGVRHVFFNGNNHFGAIQIDQRQDWGSSYISPYDPGSTYNQWLLDHGFETVAPKSWHFGREAHAAWSRFMLQYIMDNGKIS